MTDFIKLKGRGFAEGTYWNTCIHCKGMFRGDKRATSCKGCAISYFKIKELEDELKERSVDYLQAEGQCLDLVDKAVAEERERCVAILQAAYDEAYKIEEWEATEFLRNARLDVQS